MTSRRALLIAAALLLLTATPGASARQASRGPAVLTALADIGTVYWRHSCRLHQPVRYSLGVRIFYTATTRVTFHAGTITGRRTLQPEEMTWFRSSPVRHQTLSFSQATEPGVLRARVLVDWRYKRGIGHCEDYLPPRFTAQLYPRDAP
jgi:hypothetical protein